MTFIPQRLINWTCAECHRVLKTALTSSFPAHDMPEGWLLLVAEHTDRAYHFCSRTHLERFEERNEPFPGERMAVYEKAKP